MSGKQAKTTKKVVKRRLNFKRVFLLALVIALLSMTAKEFVKLSIDTIVVEGNKYVSDSNIIKASNLTTNSSYFKISEKKICKTLKQMSLINTCSIKKGLDRKITINITEHTPLFFYLNSNKLVLSNGKQVQEVNTFGVPTLINYVPEKVLNEFISGLNEINSDIIHSISEIEYTPSTNSDGTYIDEERFMLSMNDGNIVYINNNNLSILNRYNKIYASIGDRKGYFNFDCDYNNYIFKEFEE